MAHRIVELGPRLVGNVLACALLFSCGDRLIQLAADPDGDAAVNLDAGEVVDAGPPQRCGDAACACDNGLDDDDDGLIDGLDPECTGARDNDEGTFGTGAPGNSVAFCQDCFFDDNSGSEDDGCQIHIECVYGRVPAGPSGAACFACEVSQSCQDTCRPRTPNGCDCFGCCTVERGTLPRVNVRLETTCSLDALDDEFACPRCVPNDACRNPCGRCELCPGRSVDQLPMDCRAGGKPMDPRHKCDDREKVCDDNKRCAAGFYCQLGCCLPSVD